MILVHSLRLPLDAPQSAAEAKALHKLGPAAREGRCALHRVSVDARHKKPVMVYSIAVELADPEAEQTLYASFDKDQSVGRIQPGALEFTAGNGPLPGPVVVCGMGPAGLFAAHALAKAGFAPLVLERGPDIDKRAQAVERFGQGGPLDPEANIQFGEGGAGTFSDGKLTTRINDPLCAEVTRTLLGAGAPEEIRWRAGPHIGTDRLRGVMKTLRQQLVALGGQVRFETKLTGLRHQNGRLAAVRTEGGEIACGLLVRAVGHSARDTFEMLAGTPAGPLPKPFAVGFRIEQLQRDIDEGLYHGAAGHPALPPGEYRLAARFGGAGVYTFCMCPGGSVVAASSQEDTVVTNGMSLHARNGPNANAAVVTGVDPAGLEGGPLAGVALQRALEKAAFAAGGGGYTAPAETLGSFLEEKGRLDLGRVQPSYPRGVRGASLSALLGAGRAELLRAGLVSFSKKLPGFGPGDALLTGLETRTSSPVRLPRGEDCESPGIAGLYPCGEGAGYAGGIMSAAVDGLRVARAIIGRYAPPGGPGEL